MHIDRKEVIHLSDANRDIAAKLLSSRSEMRDGIFRFQEVRAESESVLKGYYAKKVNELNDFMRMCSRSESKLEETLGEVVVKFGHEKANSYGYVRPFYKLAGHGIMGQVNDFGLTYHFDSKTIAVISDECRDEALMEKLDTAIVGAKKKAYLVEVPGINEAVFPNQAKYSLALIVSFFYNRGAGKNPERKLKNAIASAKKLIEETDYLVKDGYGRSVAECLFCLENGQQS